MISLDTLNWPILTNFHCLVLSTTANLCPHAMAFKRWWCSTMGQFSSSSFSTFTQDCSFKHTMSSPYYPQGNEFAEAAVKIINDLSFPRCLSPRYPTSENCVKFDEIYHEQQQKGFNRQYGTRTLPELRNGDDVWITNLKWKRTVQTSALGPKSCTVDRDEGAATKPNPHLSFLWEYSRNRSSSQWKRRSISFSGQTEFTGEGSHPRDPIASGYLKGLKCSLSKRML